MLVIRDIQMQAFQKAQDERFAGWAVNHLRRMCSEEVTSLSDDELRRRVHVGLAVARRSGFREPELISEFLVLMIRRGPNFADHPAVRKALARNVPHEAALLLLISALSKAEWAAVQAQRDDSLWKV